MINYKFTGIAEELASKFRSNAYKLDKEILFPSENLKLLKEARLMNFLIPEVYGGCGGNMSDYVTIAKTIASGCLSTAMIWSMHCQQVACIVNHASEEFKEEILTKIAEGNYYLGSAISENEKGGHIFKANAALTEYDGRIILNRFAPVVTGGIHCDAYLVTMKKDEAAFDTEIKIVYVERKKIQVKAESDWKTMGMRSTYSTALSFYGEVQKRNILNDDSNFNEIAYQSMIPVGHIGWSASWLGAATEALRMMIKVCRNPKNKSQFNLDSELFLEKLARIRINIDVVNSLIKEAISEYDVCMNTTREKLSAPKFVIKINNLKIISSEMLFQAVNDLVGLGGFKFGYMSGEDKPLERIFRDLRSASIMINNNRLLISNGKLVLLDRSL